MSTDALPIPTQTPLGPDGLPRCTTGVSKRMDRVRLLELRKLRAEGMSELDAWSKIALDPRIGIAHDRRRGSISVPRAVRTYANFLERVTPGAVAEAKAGVLERLAAACPAAAQTIVDLAAGEFGEGRVTIRGRGDDAHEVVEIDATAARVRLDASRTVIASVGVSDRGATPGAIAAVQVNLGPSAHEIADAVASLPPEQRALAQDLAVRLTRGAAPAS